ncbi:MAG: DDE-type integrase/transposase/recombinase [Tissierellia bacterium]|nr:DDE-type integrase/transposase/recombinase [Tissierellia bacterium]
MDENLRQSVALFRYSLIAPLVTETFTQATAKEYLEEVSAKEYTTPLGNREYAPATIKEWLRLYRRFGIDGLYPKIRSDKGKSRNLPDDAKEFIVSTKLNSPKRSAKSIYQELIAKGYVNYDEISLSTVQRFISKSNISSKELEGVQRLAFEFEFPNECWQSDISVGPYLNIGGKKHKTYIVAILDDSSRLIIHAEAFFKDNLLSLLSVFKKAISKRGIPKKLFVDNGKVYKSNQMQFICANLGTILSFARPYSPESKGKIERWFRTLQDQWMNVINWNDFSSLEELNSSLFKYVEEDYNSKVHSSTHEKPIDKFIRHIDLIKFIPTKQEIDYIFLYRVTRRVKKDSTISIQNILFEIPQKYVGDTINIRYDPTSMDKAYVFSDDNLLLDTIYPVKKIDNSKIRRENNFKSVDFSSFNPSDKENERSMN